MDPFQLKTLYDLQDEFDLENQEELGKGSFGIVMAARCKKDNIVYAIKYAKETREFDIFAQYLMEAFVFLRLENANDNIIHLKGLYIGEQVNKFSKIRTYTLALVMEKADLSLEQEIQNRIKNNTDFSQEEFWDIAKQVISGLHSLYYDHKVQHRDIKAENILLKDSVPKISDLGTCRVAQQDAVKTTLGTQTEFETFVQGTRPYLAPELYKVYDSGEVDLFHVIWEKCDVFSLGVTLWKIVTCNMEDRFTYKQLNNIGEGQTVKLIESKVKNPQMAMMLTQMLKYDPKKRISLKQLIELYCGGVITENKQYIKEFNIKMKKEKLKHQQKIQALMQQQKEEMAQIEQANSNHILDLKRQLELKEEEISRLNQAIEHQNLSTDAKRFFTIKVENIKDFLETKYNYFTTNKLFLGDGKFDNDQKNIIQNYDEFFEKISCFEYLYELSLNLSGIGIGNKKIRLLGKALTQLQKLKVLSLQADIVYSQRIYSDDIMIFLKGLEKLQLSSIDLNFDKNALNDECIISMARTIARIKTLRHVKLIIGKLHLNQYNYKRQWDKNGFKTLAPQFKKEIIQILSSNLNEDNMEIIVD